jgi:hypothetical protein
MMLWQEYPAELEYVTAIRMAPASPQQRCADAEPAVFES